MFLDTDLESDDIGNRDSYQGESLLREKFSDDADVQCVDSMAPPYNIALYVYKTSVIFQKILLNPRLMLTMYVKTAD